jgi:lipopolysaccharide export system protein LptA
MGKGAGVWGVWGLLVILVCGVVRPVAGQEKAGKSERQQKAAPGTGLVDSLSLTSRREPIHIRSRTLEFRYNDKRITYHGDVVVTQGDVTVKSDLLTVTYEEPVTGDGAAPAKAENITSRQRLKEIVAEGNVDITTADRRATGKKAVFNETNRTVVLSGNAVLQEGGNRVTGESVTVFLDEKRSVVEGGGGERRAEMLLILQQPEDGKKGAKSP